MALFNRIRLVPLPQMVVPFAAISVVSEENGNKSFCMDAIKSFNQGYEQDSQFSINYESIIVVIYRGMFN